MSMIPQEIITKISNVQTQIWQTVSLTVSEACGQTVSFETPLTVGARPSEMYGEMNAPMMVIQFAFASMPENTQIVLLSQETVTSLATLIQGSEVEEIDENIVSDLRSVLEGIVQGLCLSVGNILNNAMVASGLNVRFQIFSFPPNLQQSDEIVRTQIALSGEDLNGTAIWLIDAETAHMILGETMVESDPSPFPQAASFEQQREVRAPHPLEDHNALELLLDIPLEISVELGRVKMMVRDVVELGTGSIVEIDKAAGEPVDVMVNGRLVARGEVVVIEDNFGVRITEVLNPHERNGRGEAA